MIDIGLVMLVNNGLSSPPSTIGGFFLQLPKNQPLPSWTYRGISQTPNTTLRSSTGLRQRRIQIDCYGSRLGDGSDAIELAASIDAVLNGYQGTLPDPDSTYVSSCFQSDVIDFFDDSLRTYRRMLEYELLFVD